MPTIKCDASGCKHTDASGKIFFQCNHCSRWWCSDHGREGKECVACHKGYLHR